MLIVLHTLYAYSHDYGLVFDIQFFINGHAAGRAEVAKLHDTFYKIEQRVK